MQSFSWYGFADATPRAPIRDATRTQLESSPRKSRASVRCCGSTKANPRKHVYVGLRGGKEDRNERGDAREQGEHSRNAASVLARNLQMYALFVSFCENESLRQSFREQRVESLWPTCRHRSNESLLPTWVRWVWDFSQQQLSRMSISIHFKYLFGPIFSRNFVWNRIDASKNCCYSKYN